MSWLGDTGALRTKICGEKKAEGSTFQTKGRAYWSFQGKKWVPLKTVKLPGWLGCHWWNRWRQAVKLGIRQGQIHFACLQVSNLCLKLSPKGSVKPLKQGSAIIRCSFCKKHSVWCGEYIWGKGMVGGLLKVNWDWVGKRLVPWWRK